MFSPGFRTFIDDRFPTPPPLRDGSRRTFAGVAQRGRVVELAAEEARTQGLAEVWWRTRSTQPTEWAGKTVYQNLVTLEESPRVDVQVGIAAVTFKDAGGLDERRLLRPAQSVGHGPRLVLPRQPARACARTKRRRCLRRRKGAAAVRADEGGHRRPARLRRALPQDGVPPAAVPRAAGAGEPERPEGGRQEARRLR